MPPQPKQSLGILVASDGHNAATRHLGNNGLKDTAVVSGMKDARFILPVLSGQQTIRGFKGLLKNQDTWG